MVHIYIKVMKKCCLEDSMKKTKEKKHLYPPKMKNVKRLVKTRNTWKNYKTKIVVRENNKQIKGNLKYNFKNLRTFSFLICLFFCGDIKYRRKFEFLFRFVFVFVDHSSFGWMDKVENLSKMLEYLFVCILNVRLKTYLWFMWFYIRLD